MTLRKRLCVLWAVLSQSWHEKTCAECGSTTLHIGPPTELIFICDACELVQMEKFAHEMNRRYEEEMEDTWRSL